MQKLFNITAFALFMCLIASNTSYAAGKTAYVMSCKTGNLGQVVIEPIIYDINRGHKLDNALNYNNRNFFDLRQSTKEKLSLSLVEGNVLRKNQRWIGQTLIGYMEEYPRNNLPNKKRTLNDKVPLVAKSHRGPGAEMMMTIENNTIFCGFKTPKNIYTKIEVSFYQITDTENICSADGDEKSLRVKWFTNDNQDAVKTTDILMSCGFRSGSQYDVSEARITTIGSVTVNLSRNRTLHNPDSSLYPRN